MIQVGDTRTFGNLVYVYLGMIDGKMRFCHYKNGKPYTYVYRDPKDVK